MRGASLGGARVGLLIALNRAEMAIGLGYDGTARLERRWRDCKDVDDE